MRSSNIGQAVAALAVAVVAPSAALAAGAYAISKYTAGSGGTGNGGEFTLSGTAGRTDAATVMSGGEFRFTGGFWAGTPTAVPAEPILLVSLESCAVHDAGGPNETELCITQNDTAAVEPRRNGPETLRFQADGPIDAGTVMPENVQITCGHQAPAYTVSLVGPSTIAVALTAPMSDIDCCTFAFEGIRSVDGGALVGTAQLTILGGDLNGSGDVTGSDPSLLKVHLGESLVSGNLSAPQWDFDRNGAVTGADFSLMKPLLGHIASCPP